MGVIRVWFEEADLGRFPKSHRIAGPVALVRAFDRAAGIKRHRAPKGIRPTFDPLAPSMGPWQVKGSQS